MGTESGTKLSTTPRQPRTRAPVIQDAVQQVAGTIQQYIETEGLEPGARLGTEQELRRRFGVSRPTLREALRLLSAGHMIRAARGPGGGIFVTRTVAEGVAETLAQSIAMMAERHAVSLEEMLEMRTIIEPPLAGLAAERATTDELAELRAIVDAQRAGLGSPAGIRPRESDFHRTIAAASRNRLSGAVITWAFEVLVPTLQEVLQPVVDEVELLHDHEVILDALVRRERSRAERSMRNHLGRLHELLQAVHGS